MVIASDEIVSNVGSSAGSGHRLGKVAYRGRG